MTEQIDLFRMLLILVAVGACWLLATQVGVWTSLLIWSVAMGAGCVLAVAVLRTAPVGRITWKNRLAGFFLPFGYAIGRGKLPAIALVSWLVWVLIGTGVSLVVWGMNRPGAGTASQANPKFWATLLFIGWAIDTAGTLYVLGIMRKNFRIRSTSGQQLLKIILILLGLIGASVVLWTRGNVRPAAIVAVGPPLALALVYGLFIVVVVIPWGNRRWN